MDTEAFPPPPAPAGQPSHWTRHKGKYLIGAAAVVGIGVIGAATAEPEEEAAPATTEAVETTEAPAPETTEAPAETVATAPPVTAAPVTAPPPAPAEPSLAVLVEDLWEETDYCYTDCSNAYTAQEWVNLAEQYGTVDADDFVFAYGYTDGLSYSDLDLVCDGFWVMADDDVAANAVANGIDPAAFVLNLYVWCDS